MAKTNPKKQSKASAKAIMAGVRKEMQRPRVAQSARKKEGHFKPSKGSFSSCSNLLHSPSNSDPRTTV